MNDSKKEDAKPIRLNLGCGFRRVDNPEWINIDMRPETNPDLVLDVTKGLPHEDNSVEEVRAFDFLEHVPLGQTVPLMEEIYRVLKPGGKFEHFTPSTDGRGAFQDPHHKSFWNLNSWLYFMDDEHRNLYGIKAKFRGELENRLTDAQISIFHVRGVLFAVKD